jgi:hypothetical protein
LDTFRAGITSHRPFERRLDPVDLRAAVSAALDVTPIDERVLRLRVWEYVGTERDAGATAGHVIVSLTVLVEAAVGIEPMTRQALLRSVILWFVEAYFGHIGGDVVGREDDAFGDRPQWRGRA